jgi:hypothetical protein
MYSSEQILAMDDLYELQEKASSGIPIEYQLTQGEKGWLDFIRGKYSIVDYVDENTSPWHGVSVLTIHDDMAMSQALDDDCKGWGKATMLSDDTALQKLFFWLYTESED